MQFLNLTIVLYRIRIVSEISVETRETQACGEREREFICQVKIITIFNNNNELQWQAARKGKCPSMLATINTLDNNTTK